MLEIIDAPLAVKEELEPDEKVLWWGQPGAMMALLPVLPIYIFAVPWTGISLLFIYFSFTGTKTGASLWYLSIIGVPFFLLGLLLLSSPFYAYLEARKKYYVATNRNLYVIECSKNKSVEKYDRADLINPARTEYGGRGTLTWTLQGNSAKPSFRKKNTSGELVFKNIENPRQLEKLLRN